MNTLEMWMDYADGLSGDCRVLLFGYPQELRTNQTLVTGMHAFFQTLGIKNPIFVGASDGGMVAQIYVQKYPGETGGLILISTGGMDANTLKSLKRKYFFAPLMLWYMKHCNYEKLKPTLIKAGMSHIREGDRRAEASPSVFSCPGTSSERRGSARRAGGREQAGAGTGTEAGKRCRHGGYAACRRQREKRAVFHDRSCIRKGGCDQYDQLCKNAKAP